MYIPEDVKNANELVLSCIFSLLSPHTETTTEGLMASCFEKMIVS